ncbi:MAG: PstS family phosphate ABC transporter substrate-binding protein [Immundisolibacter sp.]
MKHFSDSLKASLCAVGLLSALGGGFAGVAGAAELIQIDGSSTVYPITEAVAEEFQAKSGGDVRVTVGISGTGGGFKRFCRGETDISDASRPIKKSEMQQCAEAGIKYFELPVAYDGLTVVVNKENDWVDYLTVAELKKMWEPAAQEKVTNWKQIRSTFPDMQLNLAGPGADSGTFDYFTEAVVGESKASRGDFQASEDDNVIVQFVSRDKGALGYFGLAYYEENKDKLKAVPIKADANAPAVMPSVETVNNGTYTPLSRPIFIYVKEASMKRPAVREFVEFYLTEGAELAKEVGYVDLPAEAYKLALENIRNGKLGTGFGGEAEVGLAVEELLKRERKL